MLLLSGLRCALRILAPEADTRWVTRPDGQSVLARIPRAPKPVPVPQVAELYRWGLALMVDSATLADPQDQRLAYRDGLLIALCAARPVRRRTMAGLQLGEQLARVGDQWRLALEPADMKNRRVLGAPFPAGLNARMDHYLSEVRPRLLGQRASTAVWLEADGAPMSRQAITRMVYRRSQGIHPVNTAGRISGF